MTLYEGELFDANKFLGIQILKPVPEIPFRTV